MENQIKFQKENLRLYKYQTNIIGIYYTLEFDSCGVERKGRCWRLYQNGNGERRLIASFVVEDDDYFCHEENFGSRLWTLDGIMKEAKKLVADIVDNSEKSESSSNVSSDIKERIKNLSEEARAVFDAEDDKSEPPAANWLLRKALKIIESLVPQEVDEKHTAEKTDFVVHITETFGRSVIIRAYDESEACEIAENLCNNGFIDITSSDDLCGRTVESSHIATDDDKKIMESYSSWLKEAE